MGFEWIEKTPELPFRRRRRVPFRRCSVCVGFTLHLSDATELKGLRGDGVSQSATELAWAECLRRGAALRRCGVAALRDELDRNPKDLELFLELAG